MVASAPQQLHKIPINDKMYTHILNACAESKRLEVAKGVFARLCSETQPNLTHYNTLLKVCVLVCTVSV